MSSKGSITYLEAIREAQYEALRAHPSVFLYGQDIDTFGGAFKATKNLGKEFPGRVFDSPISEDAMIGLAIGAAIEGARPIVEMQFADLGPAQSHYTVRLGCATTRVALESSTDVCRPVRQPFHRLTDE